MQLSTTLLHHAAPGRPHYDWLIVDPSTLGQPDARLWTVRVESHWREWAARGRVELTPLPPHRRRYLDWQGTLSGGRGQVRTAGRGVVVPHLWTPHRIELTLRTAELSLGLSLRMVGPRGDALPQDASRGFSVRHPPPGRSY